MSDVHHLCWLKCGSLNKKDPKLVFWEKSFIQAKFVPLSTRKRDERRKKRRLIDGDRVFVGNQSEDEDEENFYDNDLIPEHHNLPPPVNAQNYGRSSEENDFSNFFD